MVSVKEPTILVALNIRVVPEIALSSHLSPATTPQCHLSQCLALPSPEMTVTPETSPPEHLHRLLWRTNRILAQ